MRSLLQDLRFGIRKLASSPGFTAVAVLTLALGIGANAAIFSLLDAVLLRPLPLDHPERVVQIRDHHPGHPWNQLSVPNYRDYRAGTDDLFRRYGMLHTTPLFLPDSMGSEELQGLYASADLLRMLDVQPAAGRLFTDEEDRGELEHVAILSHDFARRHFGASEGSDAASEGNDATGGEGNDAAGPEAAVGRTLTLKYWSSGHRDGQPRGYHAETFTVVGVLPPTFELPPIWRLNDFQVSDPQVLIPAGLWSWGLDNRGMYAFPTLAELEPDASIEEARARLETIAARIAEEHPDTNGDYRVSVETLAGMLEEQYRAVFLLLGGSVGLVLLLACVNVATLLLSRSTVRRTEFAVRAALGAGRRRLARQVLTENALIALAGGAAGLLVAYGTTGVLVSLTPAEIPRLQQAGVDLRTIGFTFGIAALTVLLTGSLPALRVGRQDLTADLKEGGRGRAGGSRRLLKGLQIAEIALAVVLLVGAGLLAHSFLRMDRADLGIDTHRKLTVELELPPRQMTKYKERPDRRRLWQRIQERLRGVAGVEWAEWISSPPINDRSQSSEVTLADATRPDTYSTADWRGVSPGFLRRTGIDLLAGRYFEEGDELRPVVIVDETLAKRFWPDGEAVGGEIYYGKQDLSAGPFPREMDRLTLKDLVEGGLSEADQERGQEILEEVGDRRDKRYPIPIRLEVVGVVENVRHRGPRAEPQPQYYMPLRVGGSASFVLGTGLDPERLAGPVRAAIREVDPEEPTVASIRTVKDYASATMAESRFQTTLVGAFAAVALLLATVGLYGVVSYSVGRRIREMGVRQVLGARRRDILRLVVGEGVRIALWGLVPGMLAGVALSRYLESLLFRVGSLDPWTYGAVGLLLLAVTALASYVPARRAVRADPVEALRAE